MLQQLWGNISSFSPPGCLSFTWLLERHTPLASCQPLGKFLLILTLLPASSCWTDSALHPGLFSIYPHSLHELMHSPAIEMGLKANNSQIYTSTLCHSLLISRRIYPAAYPTLDLEVYSPSQHIPDWIPELIPQALWLLISVDGYR